MSIIDGIEKTGFELENKVTDILEEKGWSVINNRFYLDDSEDKPREIDILAYKPKIRNGIHFYTVAIISCKKADENVWCFITRNPKDRDPNFDPFPIFMWSNDPATSFQIERDRLFDSYYSKVIKDEALSKLFSIKEKVVGFQELKKVSFAPQNDKAIFGAISSLFKAQNYELNNLSNRERVGFYDFHLISVLNGEMHEVKFQNGQKIVAPFSRRTYLFEQMINKKRCRSRIHFVSFDEFPTILEDLLLLHEKNVSYISERRVEFFTRVFVDIEKWSFLLPQFNNEIKVVLHLFLRRFNEEFEAVYFQMEGEILVISFNTTEEVLEKARKILVINQRIQQALKDIFQFEGDFKLVSGVPF